MAAPKKNTAFTFSVGLVAQANRPNFKAAPTLAAGDFKVSIDGGAFANLTNLPTVTPAAGTRVEIVLTAAEMNGDNIYVQCIDAAGAEWDDVLITFETTVSNADDLATQASVNTIDDFLDTEVAAIKAKTDLIPAAPAAVGDIPTADITAILADTNDIQTRLPAALVGGRIDASVGAMAADVLTAAATAADFTTEVTSGLATVANQTTIIGYLDTEVATILAAVDTEVAAIKAVTDALPEAGALTTIQADLNDIQTRLPAALVGGRIDANLSAIGNDTTALTAFKRAVLGNVIGTVGAASSTTSIVTASLTPAAAVIDQYKGRILVFDKDTTTANLRGQGTDITANTALGVLTVTALTDAPAAGDTFTIT